MNAEPNPVGQSRFSQPFMEHEDSQPRLPKKKKEEEK